MDASKRCHSGLAGGGAIFCCLPSLGTTVLEITTSTTHPRTKSELCISMKGFKLHPHEFWHTTLPSHWFQWMALIEWLPLSPGGPILATTIAQRKPANAWTMWQKCFQCRAGCRVRDVVWMVEGHWCRNSPRKLAHSSGHMAFGGMVLLCHLSNKVSSLRNRPYLHCSEWAAQVANENSLHKPKLPWSSKVIRWWCLEGISEIFISWHGALSCLVWISALSSDSVTGSWPHFFTMAASTMLFKFGTSVNLSKSKACWWAVKVAATLAIAARDVLERLSKSSFGLQKEQRAPTDGSAGCLSIPKQHGSPDSVPTHFRGILQVKKKRSKWLQEAKRCQLFHKNQLTKYLWIYDLYTCMCQCN